VCEEKNSPDEGKKKKEEKNTRKYTREHAQLTHSLCALLSPRDLLLLLLNALFCSLSLSALSSVLFFFFWREREQRENVQQQ
jgi:Na+/melibiose symporter-like transporter